MIYSLSADPGYSTQEGVLWIMAEATGSRLFAVAFSQPYSLWTSSGMTSRATSRVVTEPSRFGRTQWFPPQSSRHTPETDRGSGRGVVPVEVNNDVAVDARPFSCNTPAEIQV